jgi:hypothetical protein
MKPPAGYSKPFLTTKSGLSRAQALLVELLQQINYGRIEHLRIRAGMPVFEPPPRVVRTLKMCSDTGPRPEADLEDFSLKRQTIEMLQKIAEVGDGEILTLEVKGGLAFSMEVEARV